MKKIFSILIYIFLPIFLLMLSINILVFDINFYQEKYDEFQVFDKVNMEKKDVMYITKELIDYFKGKERKYNFDKVFNQKEMIHINDVKKLFYNGFLIRDISLGIIIVSIFYLFTHDFFRLIKDFITCSVLSLSFISIIGILFLLDFDKYFTYFHILLFNNDFWLLDPNESILINLYPQEFFISIFIKIIILFILFMSIILIIGLKQYKKRRK